MSDIEDGREGRGGGERSYSPNLETPSTLTPISAEVMLRRLSSACVNCGEPPLGARRVISMVSPPSFP